MNYIKIQMPKWILKVVGFIFSKIHCASLILLGFLISIFFNSDYTWNSITILHGILTIISLLFLTVILFINYIFQVDLTFEGKNALKRDLSLLPPIEEIMRCVILILGIALKNATLSIILIGLIFSIFYAVIVRIVLNSFFYYDTKINKFFAFYLLISSMGGISLLLTYVCQFFEEFTGGILLVCFGALIIVLMLITLQTNKDFILDLTKENIEDSNKVIYNLKSMIEAIKNIGKSNYYQILIKSYIFKHLENCTDPDCPLYLNKMSNNKNELKLSDLKKLEEKIISKCFIYLSNAVSKFSDENKAGFLIEIIKNHSLALKELEKISTYHPPIFYNFYIYRYMQTVRNSILNFSRDEEEKLNIKNAMAYDTCFSLLRNKIVQSTFLYTQIWGYLSDETPDFKLLLKHSTDAFKLIKGIENNWQRISQMNINSINPLLHYQEFLKNALNDKAKVFDLTQKYKNSSLIDANSNFKLFHSNDIDQLTKRIDGSACVAVEGQYRNAGKINRCNNSFCKMFGYNNNEIIGSNIQTIMPDIYAKYHQDCFIDYLQSRNNDPKNLKNEKFVFAKHLNGYIFPITIKIIETPSLINFSNFIAIFSLDKKLANSDFGYILLDDSKKITNISSSVELLLGMKLEYVKFDSISFESIFPNIRLSEYKMESTIDIHLFKIARQKTKALEGSYSLSSNIIYNSGNLSDFILSRIENEKNSAFFNMSEIKMRNELIGYSIKVEKKIEKMFVDKLSNLKKEQFNQNFQLLYDNSCNRYVRDNISSSENLSRIFSYSKLSNVITSSKEELSERRHSFPKNSEEFKNEQNKKEISKNEALENDEAFSKSSKESECISIFYSSLRPKINQLAANFKVQSNHPILEKIIDTINTLIPIKEKDFGKNIFTFRFDKGEFLIVNKDNQINEEKSSEIDNYLNLEEDIHIRRDANKTKGKTIRSIHSREALLSKIKEEGVFYEFKVLRFISFLFFASILALSAIIYSISTKQLASSDDELNVIYEISTSITYMHKIIYWTKELVLLQSKLINNSSETILNLQEKIKYSLIIFFEKFDEVGDHSLSFAYKDAYLEYFDDDIIPISTKLLDEQIITSTYPLYESTNQFISKGYEVTSMTTFSNKDSNIFFILENGINSITQGMFDLRGVFLHEFHEITLEFSKTSLICLIISLFICILQSLLFLVLSRRVLNYTNKAYYMFLEVPSKAIRIFGDKCETFYCNLKSDKMIENDSIDDIKKERNEEEEELLSSHDYSSRRMRHFKNESQTRFKLVIFLIGIALFVCSFFISIFFIDKVYIEGLEEFSHDFEDSVLLLPLTQIALNVQREYFNNSMKTILSSDPFQMTLNFSLLVYNQSISFVSRSGHAYQYVDQEHKDQIDRILQGNLCLYQEYNPFKSVNLCSNFMEGVGTQGLNVVIASFLRLYRGILFQYESLRNNSQPLSDIFKSSDMSNLEKLEDEFLTPFSLKVNNIILNGEGQYWDNLSIIRVSIFILFILVLVLMYFIILQIVLNILEKRYINSKNILTLMPIEIIVKLKDSERLFGNSSKIY